MNRLISRILRAVMIELAQWRVIAIPGNPNGTVWLIDRKPAN